MNDKATKRTAGENIEDYYSHQATNTICLESLVDITILFPFFIDLTIAVTDLCLISVDVQEESGMVLNSNLKGIFVESKTSVSTDSIDISVVSLSPILYLR